MIYDTIVVGAGASGITFALEAARRGSRAIVLERRSGLGGLGATKQVRLPDGSIFDWDIHGAHVFNAIDPDVKRWVFDLMPEDQWHRHVRDAKAILPDGTYVPYPVERSGFDWATSTALPEFDLASAGSYGKVLADEYAIDVARRYLLHYDAKLWGAARLADLDLDFRPSTMPRSTPGALDGAHTHEVFYYPKREGYGAIFQRIADAAMHAGVMIMYDAEVVTIDYAYYDGNHWIVHGRDFECEARTLVYTGPLADLPGICPRVKHEIDPGSRSAFVDLASAPLTCVLTNDPETHAMLRGSCWIYLPDPAYAFHKIENVGRIGGRSDAISGMISTKLGIGSVPGEIARSETMIAYPLPNKARTRVLRGMQAVESSGFYLIGRLATWTHQTVDRCISDALILARRLFP